MASQLKKARYKETTFRQKMTIENASLDQRVSDNVPTNAALSIAVLDVSAT